MKAIEMVAQLEEVAHRVDAADVEPWSLQAAIDGVIVHCRTADDVDVVMGMLDAIPSQYDTFNYTRWATSGEVPVRVYGPRRTEACSCGRPCEHQAVTS